MFSPESEANVIDPGSNQLRNRVWGTHLTYIEQQYYKDGFLSFRWILSIIVTQQYTDVTQSLIVKNGRVSNSIRASARRIQMSYIQRNYVLAYKLQIDIWFQTVGKYQHRHSKLVWFQPITSAFYIQWLVDITKLEI